jgi:voltage-gated sodium channel
MKMWWRGSSSPADRDVASKPREDRGHSSQGTEPRWRPLATLVDSESFQIFIGAVIVANAVVLGLETYSGIMADHSSLLNTLNTLFYSVFLVELVLRILSYGRKPWNFFRHGWNIFDFIVIGGALLPFVRDHATILRLLRLARIVRLMRFLPDARILLTTVTRATPAVMSMVVLTILVLFIYGILGWTLFGESLPDQWGDVGSAMLTLFILLTLEEFPEYLAQAQQVSPLATIFFLSYILIAAFIIVNLLIGIVISSMERAREEEASEAREKGLTHKAILLEQITAMRRSLDEIESEVNQDE